jgi:hypothetical protein
VKYLCRGGRARPEWTQRAEELAEAPEPFVLLLVEGLLGGHRFELAPRAPRVSHLLHAVHAFCQRQALRRRGGSETREGPRDVLQRGAEGANVSGVSGRQRHGAQALHGLGSAQMHQTEILETGEHRLQALAAPEDANPVHGDDHDASGGRATRAASQRASSRTSSRGSSR